MISKIGLAAILFTFSNLLLAQDDAQPPKEIAEGASARLTILALGPGDYSYLNEQFLKNFKQQDLNDPLKPIDPKNLPSPESPGTSSGSPSGGPPDGAVPYTSLLYDATSFKKRTDSGDSKPKWRRVRCGFNGTAGTNLVHAGKSIKLYYESRDNPSAKPKPFITIPALEPATQYLIVLTPAKFKPKLWTGKLNIRMFNLSENDYEKNPAYLCNLSRKPIALQFDKREPILLEPGQTNKQSLARTKRPYALKAYVADTKEKIFDSGITASSANVTAIIFYGQVPNQNAGKSIAFFKTTQYRHTEEELAEIIPTESSEPTR